MPERKEFPQKSRFGIQDMEESGPKLDMDKLEQPSSALKAIHFLFYVLHLKLVNRKGIGLALT